MYQNDEVLSFEVAFAKTNKVKVIDKLAHFDKAPFGMSDEVDQDRLNMILFSFLTRNAIAASRWDYEEILKNTGVKNSFELVFKGHGLSLSHHYWFKKENENLRYEDINFFTNKWDDSFARAVLSGDYKALKNVDLNVPDIVTAGWGIKGWLREEDGPKLYKLGIAKDHYEEALAEVLCSKLAKRLFRKDEFLEYQLKEINGRYASVSKVVIGIDEELIPLAKVVSADIYNLYHIMSNDRKYNEEFFKKISDCGLEGMHEFFVHLRCWRSLCFVNDLHFNNLSVIRNIKTGKIRLAPAMDFGSSFGSSKSGREFLSNINKATYLIVYFMFSDLDPNWDYSWYKSESLIGFEDEIKETLSKSEFYTPQLIENIIDVYRHQKSYLDDLAKSCNNK